MSENAGMQVTRVGRAGQPPRSELTELGEKECWKLLRAHDLGRLAIVVDGAPLIFPINYAAHAGAILFQTSPGLKLTRGPGSRSAFEIDGYDSRSATGWSVVVTGVLQDISDAADHVAVELRAVAVWPMAPGLRTHRLALYVDEVSGRRFNGGAMVPPVPFGTRA